MRVLPLNHKRAFTLIELMVVLAIIGITTAVIVAEMGGTFEDALLRANARKLIDVCDMASNRAIAAHQAQILRIEARTGRYVVRAKPMGDEATDEVPTAVGEFDSRIKIEIREPQRALDGEGEESERAVDLEAITFSADGSTEAREFIFRDRAGVEMLLRLNPATSRVRVLNLSAK